MTSLTMFTWGYSGWGSSTPQLKQAVDAIEKSRGYAPPFFVDIRIRRSVRADGFRDSAFEETLGKARYRWMPALGNRRILTRSGPRVQINEPEAVEELLGLALARRKRRERVIFFCGCPFPATCHRMKVASLLVQTARRRNAGLTVVEWPGGTPTSVSLDLSDEEAKKLLRGKHNVSLGERQPATELLALPWASVVHLRSSEYSLRGLADPARYQGGEWLLPVPYGMDEDTLVQKLRQQALRDRRKYRFEPRRNWMII